MFFEIALRASYLSLFYSFGSFSHQRLLVVFLRRVSDSKSPQASWNLLSIVADLSNEVVGKLSSRTLISNSPSPYTNPLVTVPSAPTTIGFTVTFKFYSFFQFSSKDKLLISFFAFFQFYSVVSRNGKVHNSTVSRFC